jgi:alpha-galactosidase
VRRASDRDLAELSAWVSFHKEQRDLLHHGDLVRLDFPDASLTATAVIAPDRSRALYSFASVDRADVVLLGRLRFPGLDPDRRYRVRPLLVGTPPSGLFPPPWWGVGTAVGQGSGDGGPEGAQAWANAGVELPGRILTELGLAHAPVDPDQVVLFAVDAVG